MNCFEIVLFVLLSAFMPSLTTVGATDYEIPEACPTDTTFPLNGATMAGSTFTYKNSRNLIVAFYVALDKSNNPGATVTFRTDTETKTYNQNFIEKVNKERMNFSLTGGWSDTDIGTVSYQSEDGNYEDCYNRAATDLFVGTTYDFPRIKEKDLTIRASENCGVQVTLGGVSKNNPDQCDTTLEFSTGEKINASLFGNQVTTVNSPISFRILSDCTSTKVHLYFQENCPSTTAKTSKPTNSSPPMTKTSKPTDSSPPMTETSKSTDSSPPKTTKSRSTDSSPPLRSGVNVVLSSLVITAILTWRMPQW